MVGLPICLAEECEYYMSPRACSICLQTETEANCFVCGDKPAIPIYHKSPDPFFPIQKGTCKCCETEDVWINNEDNCSTCNKLPITRRARINYLCGTHASMVKALCMNGHIMTGPYVKGTLYCKTCATGRKIGCLGCGDEFRLTRAGNSSLCPKCIEDINNNVCTNCKGSTKDSTIDERGYCDKCAEEYK